ncbi:MAG: M23 family metallopeptidase, partial [Deferribacteraceae bacterium]|nr:M23 family metallopeptidase [Deferribacteraceae bacterium]
SLIEYNIENNALKAQLAQYTTQIEDISSKIAALDDLEYRIKDLVALQKDNVPLKPVAVGGKEVDLLREYSSSAALNEKNFFSTLDSTLQELSYEVQERELNLSELAATLEEKRLVMQYTPTIVPVRGWLSSQFGYRISPFSGRQTFHEGVDIAARNGTDVRAAANGTVVFAGTKSGYGNMVTIDHGYGYLTRYGHNAENTVKPGDKVTKGQTIAKVGNTGRSTGPHVHYEVLVNGIPVNPSKFIISGE